MARLRYLLYPNIFAIGLLSSQCSVAGLASAMEARRYMSPSWRPRRPADRLPELVTEAETPLHSHSWGPIRLPERFTIWHVQQRIPPHPLAVAGVGPGDPARLVVI